MDYIGKSCWQASGFKTVYFGKVIDQKTEDMWLLLKIKWDHNKDETWEKVVNVGFGQIKKID